jgi:pilus assembly protein FimV
VLTNNPKFTRLLKPATFLLWLGLCLVSPAWGLGMGEISLKSFLGEPLQAKIDLQLEDANAYSLENIRVRQIGPAEAGRLGFDLVDGYYGVSFQPVQQGQQWYIDLTSSKPVNEPYINLLVEVRWPKGTVYREYTVLIDPPVAPAVSVAGSGQSLPVPQQSKATTVAPSAGTARADIVANSYQVQSGDSLYAIARRTESRGDQSLASMMDWIVENNPQAFVGGDRNRLKAGVGLTLPTNAQLLSAGRPVTPVVAESVLPAVPSPEPTKTPEAPAEKSLLSLEDGEAISNKPLDTDAVESLSAKVIRAQINGAQESNEKLMRENEALRQHMAMLEASDYVGNLEKLIALKDQQITELALEQEQQASEELSAQAPAAAIDSIQRPSLMPVATDAAELSSSNKGWWAFYAVLIASLLGFLFYFLRNRKSPEEYSDLAAASFKPGEEQAMLEELDNLANQFHAGDQLPEKKAEPEEQDIPDFVGKATGGRTPRSVPGRNRRPDNEVMRDIEKRIQGYSPVDSQRVMQVPKQHDEVDHIISEALAHITARKFDLAEAMLLEADFESGGKEGRLTDALEYLNYCRNAKGNRRTS